MEFPEKFMKIWWIVMIFLFGIMIILRRDTIFSAEVSMVDIIIFAGFVIILTLPLYAELTLFGMSIKQKVEKSNKEIKQLLYEQIYLVRSDFQNTISNINNQQINIYTIPSDETLKERKETVKSSAQAFTRGIDPNGDVQDIRTDSINVDDDILFAFKSRYLIELELKKIWSVIFTNPLNPRIGLTTIIDNLLQSEPLVEELAFPIKDVISISNKAIHGEKISKVQSDYLREVTPSLLSALRAINKKRE